jgi:hypothetical protein
VPKHIVCVVELVPEPPIGGRYPAPVDDLRSSSRETGFTPKATGRIRGPIIGSRRWPEARSR